MEPVVVDGETLFTIFCKSSPDLDHFDIHYDKNHAKDHGFTSKDRVAEFVWQTHPLDWRNLFRLTTSSSASSSSSLKERTNIPQTVLLSQASAAPGASSEAPLEEDEEEGEAKSKKGKGGGKHKSDHRERGGRPSSPVPSIDKQQHANKKAKRSETTSPVPKSTA